MEGKQPTDCIQAGPGIRHEGFLEKEGGRLYYRLEGGDGPVVVFIHGMTMAHDMFEQQFEPVRRAGYRILAWDVRGHGRSKPMGDAFTIPLAADDLRAILEATGIERVVLMGHSMGGMIAQEFLFRYPERVTAVFILGSLNITARQPWLARLIRPLSRVGFRFCPMPLLYWLTPVCAGKGRWARENAGRLARLIDRDEFLRIWNAIVTCDHHEPDYVPKVPYMITRGSGDHWVGLGLIRLLSGRWARSIPGCRFDIIPNAGHNACGDNTNYFNRVLLEFLDEVTRPSIVR